MKTKKAAMEMSVGTIVTIVLLMSVLVLGLIFISTIFKSGKNNIEVLDDKVKGEINKLFVEEEKTVVYLPNNEVKIKQGENWGVAWAVKNLERGSADVPDLSYEIEVSTATLQNNCNINQKEAESFIKLGQADEGIPLPPGEAYYSIVRMEIPETAPLCSIRYNIITSLDNKNYATTFFDLTIQPK